MLRCVACRGLRSCLGEAHVACRSASESGASFPLPLAAAGTAPHTTKLPNTSALPTTDLPSSGMVGTRSRKRAAEPTEEPDAAVTLEQVLGAVDAARAAILERAATVSTAQVLELCRQQLGLADAAPLRPFRQAAKERALQLLEEQVRREAPESRQGWAAGDALARLRRCVMETMLPCLLLDLPLCTCCRCGCCVPATKPLYVPLAALQGQRPAGASPPSAADLPLAVLVEILKQLDHDSLFCALQCCRAWRAAGTEPALWQQQCAQREQSMPQQAQEPQQAQQAQEVPAAPPALEQPAQPPGGGWQERYRQHYSSSCYDCFRPTERRTLQAGSLRLRLCHDCSAAYDSPRPHHRLVAASTAKRQYCLREEGEEAGGSVFVCLATGCLDIKLCCLCRHTLRQTHSGQRTLSAHAPSLRPRGAATLC